MITLLLTVAIDLFTQGEAGVHTYRIPALLETKRGTLIAMADARHDSSSDLPGRISLVMRRSNDGGQTWSPMVTVREVKEGGVGDPSLLLDLQTGRVWCFHAYGEPGVGFNVSTPGRTLEIHAIHSDDEGEHWSAPINLTPQLRDPSWQSLFATSGTHFHTRRGRYLVPLVVKDREGRVTARNAYSDDRGVTWKVGPPIGDETDESHAVELADGNVLQSLRLRNTKQRGIATSRDGGITFGPITAHADLPDPSCNAGLARRGNQLLSTNAASRNRELLTLKLSTDQGKTWGKAKLLHAGPAAYSTVLPLRRNWVGVLYEAGDRHAVEHIRFERLKIPSRR